jgi:hypothetical protein
MKFHPDSNEGMRVLDELECQAILDSGCGEAKARSSPVHGENEGMAVQDLDPKTEVNMRRTNGAKPSNPARRKTPGAGGN